MYRNLAWRALKSFTENDYKLLQIVGDIAAVRSERYGEAIDITTICESYVLER